MPYGNVCKKGSVLEAVRYRFFVEKTYHTSL